MYESLKKRFTDQFGTKPGFVFSAPGRTEIGGNHTDHQHGCVLAGAVNLDTVAAVARSERGVAVERKASDIARGHPPYELAHRLGRVERRDTRRPPHKEILRFAGSGVKSSRVSPTDARRQSPREAIASSSRRR